MALYTELIKDQRPELKSSRKGTPHIGDVVRSMIFLLIQWGVGLGERLNGQNNARVYKGTGIAE